jgi:hypothetical protein
MQIPLTEMEGRWSVICIDVQSFLAELVIFSQKKPAQKSSAPSAGTAKTKLSLTDLHDMKFDFSLSSVELCAKAYYKSVFVSDVPFEPKTLPKEMSLLLSKTESFESKYYYKKLSNQNFVVPTEILGCVNDEADPNNIRGRSRAI